MLYCVAWRVVLWSVVLYSVVAYCVVACCVVWRVVCVVITKAGTVPHILGACVV